MAKVAVVLDEQEQVELKVILSDGDAAEALRFLKKSGLGASTGSPAQRTARSFGTGPGLRRVLYCKDVEPSGLGDTLTGDKAHFKL